MILLFNNTEKAIRAYDTDARACVPITRVITAEPKPASPVMRARVCSSRLTWERHRNSTQRQQHYRPASKQHTQPARQAHFAIFTPKFCTLSGTFKRVYFKCNYFPYIRRVYPYTHTHMRTRWHVGTHAPKWTPPVGGRAAVRSSSARTMRACVRV